MMGGSEKEMMSEKYQRRPRSAIPFGLFIEKRIVEWREGTVVQGRKIAWWHEI